MEGRTAVFGKFGVVGLLLSTWVGYSQADLPPAEALPEPLTLEYVLTLADQPHPVLDLADAELSGALAERQQADALNNPKVDLDLALRGIAPSYRAADGSNNDSWAKLRVHQRLYDFGHTESLYEAANQRLRSEEWGLIDTRQQRRLEIATRFYDVLLADLETARDTEAMATAYVRADRGRERNRLGQLSDIELLELDSLYQERLRRQRISQAKQRSTRLRLAISLNRPQQLPSVLVKPEPPRLTEPVLDVDELTQQALAANPRLQALRAELAAAEQRIAAARAGNGAVVRGELEAAAYNRVLGGSNPLSAALVLEVPLYTGGSLDAEVAKFRALAREKRAVLANHQLNVRQAVLELYLELETLQIQRQELEKLGEFRDLYLDRSRSLYELEVKSDLGDAMVQTSDLLLQMAQNDFKIALALAQLDALRGRLIGGKDAFRETADKVVEDVK